MFGSLFLYFYGESAEFLDEACTIFTVDDKLLFETGVIKDLQEDLGRLSSWAMAVDVQFNPANWQHSHVGIPQAPKLS